MRLAMTSEMYFALMRLIDEANVSPQLNFFLEGKSTRLHMKSFFLQGAEVSDRSLRG